MDYCEFCLEFSDFKSEGLTFFHQLFPLIPDRILIETSNFVVVPGLGQIVEGYLLIITKKHYPSMRDIPSRIYPELDWVINRSSEILQFIYDVDCVQFEHGPSSSLQGGACCIEHAHLHIAPLNIDVAPYIVQRASYDASNYPASANSPLMAEKPYLYIRFPHKSEHQALLMDATDLPSQYMRQVIAKAVGKPNEWDWNIFLGEKELEACLTKLKPWFAQLENEYVKKRAKQDRRSAELHLRNVIASNRCL